MKKYVSIKSASEQLGIPPQGIRIMMQRGLLPIGTAVKFSDFRTTYYIQQTLIDKYLGKESVTEKTSAEEKLEHEE